jgi:hypothetical protein
MPGGLVLQWLADIGVSSYCSISCACHNTSLLLLISLDAGKCFVGASFLSAGPLLDTKGHVKVLACVMTHLILSGLAMWADYGPWSLFV